jgi:hypothetical protein
MAKKGKRRRIEVLFAQLCIQFRLKLNYAKSFAGTIGRLSSKLAAVAALQKVNLEKGRPLNHIKHAWSQWHNAIHCSAKRAMKDNHNRERGLMKLEKDVASGRLTKEHLTNRGYKKFLSLKGETKIKVDRSKIQEAQRWDGLKGYVMNTSLSKDEVMAAYRELWQIERSFRDTKSDLAARPLYHRLEHRIRAHICLCFAALKVHKELERSLTENGCPWSVHESIEIARTIKTLHGTIPETGKTIEYMMIKTKEPVERASKMKFIVKNSLRNF